VLEQIGAGSVTVVMGWRACARTDWRRECESCDGMASMCNYGKSMADSDRNAKEKGKKR
jgi:hypothetical protein